MYVHVRVRVLFYRINFHLHFFFSVKRGWGGQQTGWLTQGRRRSC